MAVAAVGLGATACPGVSRRRPIGAKPEPTPTPAPRKPIAGGVQTAVQAVPDDASRATWFTLDRQTDPNGVVIGNVVVSLRRWRSVVASSCRRGVGRGPYDEGVLVGSDDGLTSTLRFLAPRGCGRTLLTTSDEIIWRATISPDDQTSTPTIGPRDTTPSRALVAPLADPTQRRQLIGPIPTDDRFGLSLGDQPEWSAEATD